MHKCQVYLDKMLARVMLAYAIGLVVVEAIPVQYAQVSPDEVNLLAAPEVDQSSRWFLFFGSFLLLKHRYSLDRLTLERIVSIALLIFAHLIFAKVQSWGIRY